MAKLPLRYRVPLVLHEIEGWSYVDIAQELGCREGTVKSRIHRGRQQLKAEARALLEWRYSMEDHRLGDLLRELPREHARPGFTRPRAGPPGRAAAAPLDAPRLARWPPPLVAVAVAAGGLVETRGGRRTSGRGGPGAAAPPRDPRRARAARAGAPGAAPGLAVVYLGGDENVDLVLDLGKVRETEGVQPRRLPRRDFLNRNRPMNGERHDQE